MDLVYLFWSISVGIICGAGFVMIAVIASIGMTIIIVVFANMPDSKENLVLVINANSHKHESEIMEIIKNRCRYVKTRAKNVTKTNMNMAIEVKVIDQIALIDELMDLDYIVSASLVEHDGDVTM